MKRKDWLTEVVVGTLQMKFPTKTAISKFLTSVAASPRTKTYRQCVLCVSCGDKNQRDTREPVGSPFASARRLQIFRGACMHVPLPAAGMLTRVVLARSVAYLISLCSLAGSKDGDMPGDARQRVHPVDPRYGPKRHEIRTEGPQMTGPPRGGRSFERDLGTLRGEDCWINLQR